MKTRSSTLLAAAFALIAIGTATLAWKQYQELVALRAAALSGGAPAQIAQQIADLERRNRSLETQLAARGEGAGDATADTPVDRTTTGRGRNGGRGGPPDMRALMDNPQVQALRAIQEKAALDGRYAALFKRLNLPPEQLEKFKTLLAERQSTVADVMAAAREQGLDPRENRDEVRKLVSAAQAEIDNSIRAAVGESAFSEYQAYEQTTAQRAVVSQLEQRLSYSATPLTAEQSSQLVSILAANTAAPTTGATSATSTTVGPVEGFGAMGGRGPGGGQNTASAAIITPAAIAQAQTVLNATQVAALQQLQQQQQSQQQLQRVIGDTMNAQNPNAPSTPAPRGGGD